MSNQPDPTNPQQSPPASPLRATPAPPDVRHRPLSPAGAAWGVALLGWTTLLSFYHLDGRVGLEPVEAWVAQPAREMYANIEKMVADRNQAGWQWKPFILPQFCGETRMQKSPGAYWAVCLTAYLRGTPVDEVSARIPNAIAAVLMVMTVFWLARRIAGDRAAVFAGFAAASSAMVLYWSHGAASDMGVTTLMTLSLTCIWIGSETEPPGPRRILLWLAGYFFAGLAMIYKMPLPLVCIGLPAFLYVLLRNRWRILASWWHLLGLLLFLLPWLPWALAAWYLEPRALDKWWVEYFDRVTGDLPNVESQVKWFFYLLYVGAALLLSIPYSLSVPLALTRPFRREEGVHRNGMYFLLIWFVGLLVFLTVATGKETRYVLPAMPPLFVLLGIELAAFFDPQRRANSLWDRLGFWTVCLAVPGGLAYLTTILHMFWEKNASVGMFAWYEVWQPYAVAAGLFAAGAILAAWLYRRQRRNASFGALAGTMWLTWLWVWPNFMPVVASQAPFKDFAAQLKTLGSDYQNRIKQIAQQDPRYIWYSDVRFPRIIDQLELLEMVGGRRDLQTELRIVGEEMVRQLAGDELVLFVILPKHYVMFHVEAQVELEKEGRTLPETYVWMQSRVGRADRRYMLIGNRPPPWNEPQLPDVLKTALAKQRARKRAEAGLPTSAPTTQVGGASRG